MSPPEPSARRSLPPEVRDRLIAYLGMLHRAGRTCNLTRIPQHLAWERHIEESLALLDARAWSTGERVVDLGSGGGVPGIPLAIARPDLTCLLVEKSPRKGDVLRRMARELGLANVGVLARAAETLAADTTMQPVDVVVSRAAAPPAELLRLAMPLLRPGGELVAHVGRTAAVGPDLLAAAHWAGASRPAIRVVPPVRLLMAERRAAPAGPPSGGAGAGAGVRSTRGPSAGRHHRDEPRGRIDGHALDHPQGGRAAPWRRPHRGDAP